MSFLVIFWLGLGNPRHIATKSQHLWAVPRQIEFWSILKKLGLGQTPPPWDKIPTLTDFFGSFPRKCRGYLCFVISDYLLRAWCHFVLPQMFHVTFPRHWQSKAGLDTRTQQIHQWVGDRFCQGRRTPGRYSCGGHNPQPECSCSDQGPTVMRPQLFSSPMSALPRSQPRVRGNPLNET